MQQHETHSCSTFTRGLAFFLLLRSIGSVEAIRSRRFHLSHVANADSASRSADDESAAFLAHLDEHGYAVVAQAADQEHCDWAHTRFWDFCSGVRPGLKRGDARSWFFSNWLPSPATGIFSSYGFAHDDFCWRARCLPRVRAAFAQIWQTNELVVSYDGGNAFRDWRVEPTWLTEGARLSLCM
jgi:hypothetical protein